MIEIMLNGHPAEVAEGRTILEACREHGVEVPTLCYHAALEPYGACRLCMVEVSSPQFPLRLMASCVTPCENRMVVQTESELVIRSRRLTAELLMAEGEGAPELVTLAQNLVVREIRFRLPGASNCILCGLCVRACNEIVGVGAISMIYRGIAKEVSPPFKIASSTCIGCGTCVLICPTGAISLKDVISYHSIHPGMVDYEQIYCRLCSEFDLNSQ